MRCPFTNAGNALVIEEYSLSNLDVNWYWCCRAMRPSQSTASRFVARDQKVSNLRNIPKPVPACIIVYSSEFLWSPSVVLTWIVNNLRASELWVYTTFSLIFMSVVDNRHLLALPWAPVWPFISTAFDKMRVDLLLLVGVSFVKPYP